MKYSKNFERDYNWYLNNKEIFNFDGTIDTEGKIIYDDNGKTAKECFKAFDEMGKTIPTKEPELLFQIHKCKGAINFNIKMWSEDRGKGNLGSIEFKEIAKEFNLLDWMVTAVEHQKYKYYL